MPAYSEINEKELVELAKQDDREAFAEIYRRNYSRTLALIRRMSNGSSWAEDLAQDTFVAVQKHIKSFKHTCKLSSWIGTIARNEIFMRYRRPAYNESVNNSFEEMQEAGVSIAAPTSSDFQGGLDKVIIDQMLDSLPKGYRKVFELKTIYGMEYGEIAEVTGCHPGTAKSQLFKAKEVLARSFYPGLKRTKRPRRATNKKDEEDI